MDNKTLCCNYIDDQDDDLVVLLEENATLLASELGLKTKNETH